MAGRPIEPRQQPTVSLGLAAALLLGCAAEPVAPRPSAPPPGPRRPPAVHYVGDDGVAVASIEELPRCAAADVEAWTKVRDHRAGARVSGSGAEIGWYPVEKATPGKGNWPKRIGFGIVNSFHRANWHPLDDRKQTMCGRLDKFELFVGGGTEFDWNIFVVPEDKRFLEKAKKLQRELPLIFGKDFRIHRCSGGEECMEVEVTPPAAFRENTFFFGGHETPLAGGTLCAFGPWVEEYWHNHWPEIHPAQALWWRHCPDGKSGCADGTSVLVTVQDASERFEDAKHYVDLPSPLPPGWKPWAAGPIENRFEVAFEAPVASPARTKRLAVQPLCGDGVVPPDERAAARRPIEVTVGGTPLLRIDRPPAQRPEDAVDVRLAGACHDVPNRRLLGYLAVTSSVSCARDRCAEKGGYQVVQVFDPDSTAKRYEGCGAPAPTVEAEAIASSIRLEGSQLVVDVAATIRRRVAVGARFADGSARPKKLSFKEVEDPSWIVQGVPLTLAGELQIDLAATPGETSKPSIHRLGGVTIAPRILDLRGDEASAQEDGAALPAFAAAAGLGASPALGGAKLRRIRAWSITAGPRYLAMRGEEAALEEESEPAEELNDAIEAWQLGSARRAKGIFGSDRPFEIGWPKLTARRWPGPVTVAVTKKKGIPGPDEVFYTESGGESGPARLEVTFPGGAGVVYELEGTVSAAVRHVAQRGTSRFRVWSHRLEAADRDALAATAASLLGLQLATSRTRGEPAAPEPSAIETAVHRAAADGWLTPNELLELRVIRSIH